MKKVFVFVSIFFCCFLYNVKEGLTASPMKPSFEVKLLLKPEQVLGYNKEIKQEVLEHFQVGTNYERIQVQFLDTANKNLSDEGWFARIRKKEFSKDFELTYKKRYPIQNGVIQDALEVAKKEGFDSKTDSYEAEIDWGFGKKTLSISNKKSYSAKGYGVLDLPNEQAAQNMLIEKLPGKMNKWLYTNWGEEMLRDSHIYGPVLMKRYTGEFENIKTNIEIWPLSNTGKIEDDFVIEVSFKTNEESFATKQRELLMASIEKKGWLLPKDSLKTELIFQ
ncbi:MULTISPECIES: hypothetical protein [Bacillus cereus group]|uniref:Group-specific protein n=1 Tax=Bacillus toyonensis TaxID=155322 RepID=A0AB73R5V6_9BACI|nr:MULTISPECIES: hypothetical protein [Bacillus cereus group]MBJ7928802.1 hypothetical protein [Bacillus cereus group sp. N31]PEG13397.1 hypothetical protein COO04_25980 [Bacillus toyonensis]PEI89746.1 hypothetical protein CN678_00280 [Bacillus toyonensis]PEK10101.1 hypothetical protein CN681_12205 [Bacillus toyonensis]PEK44309.1 hypothetical protein CN586_17425 [Bacillus toyonensis]